MWSNKYIDLLFLPLGRGFQGVDCWGLVRLILQEELKIELPELVDFYEKADDSESRLIADKMREEAEKDWVSVDRSDIREFDVVLIRIMGLPSHVGIVVDKHHFLHIMSGQNSAIEDFRRSPWNLNGKIVGFYRHRKLWNS